MPKTKLNGEGSIRKREDGLYEVRVSAGKAANCGGYKRISKYARTEEEAVRLLHELQYLKDQSPNYINTMTLGELMDICLEVYLKNSLKQSTYNSYVCYIEKHFKPVLGHVLLSDLNPRMLQLFYNHKLEVEGLSRKTVINLNLFLHRVLSFAVGEGYIRTNPAESLNLSRGQKPEIEVLTWDEQAALIQHSYKHRYGVFVRLALFTGVRLGELLGLKWEDVDLSGKMIHIRRTLSRLNKMKRPDDPSVNTTEIVIGTPKSQNSVRSIPVIPGMMQELLGWRAVQERDRELAGDAYMASGMVVTNELGGYIEPRTFRDYYEQILAISGLKHYTFHALRHPYVKHTTKIFSLRLMDFQAQAYPDARRKTRGACQLHRGGQSQSPVRPLCNRKQFSCLLPQSKMSWILYAISMRLSGYTSTRSISSSASSVVSVSASKIALDASLRLSCRACSSCFCFACANTAA